MKAGGREGDGGWGAEIRERERRTGEREEEGREGGGGESGRRRGAGDEGEAYLWVPCSAKATKISRNPPESLVQTEGREKALNGSLGFSKGLE